MATSTERSKRRRAHLKDDHTLCGAAPSLDMIIPFARGGDPADPHNYRPAHYGCNARRGKGDRPRRRWTSSDTP